MEDWASVEKQNRVPPLYGILPNALARKLVRTAALISKTLL